MKNYFTAIIFKAIILLVLLPVTAFSAEKTDETEKKNVPPPVVVVTIKPIHSLVAAVMGEIGTPELLIDGKISEHDYAMKPSDMKKIQNADVVFFTSMDLETFIVRAIKSLREGAIAVELGASEGVIRQQAGELEYGDDKHVHGSYDPHIWLSPENAIAMVKQIKKILSIKDPKNRGIYEMNASKYIKKIATASEKITLELSPYKNIPFITFHDAYGYFVKSYGLNQAAAVSLNPEAALGAEKVSDINGLIKRKHIYCVFSDPAFSDASIKKILNNPDKVKIVTLDPVGTGIEKGEGAYLAILDGISKNLLACFNDENL